MLPHAMAHLPHEQEPEDNIDNTDNLFTDSFTPDVPPEAAGRRGPHEDRKWLSYLSADSTAGHPTVATEL